jgi:hypothetical protein
VTVNQRGETSRWVRVRLAGPADPQRPGTPALTEGELVLRADRVSVDKTEMVFVCGEEEVFRLDRRYFRSLAWFVDRPTFADWLRGRRAQYPNAHRRWSALEIAKLREAVEAGRGWPQIAAAHGRTLTAVERQAAYFGFAPAPAPGAESNAQMTETEEVAS